MTFPSRKNGDSSLHLKTIACVPAQIQQNLYTTTEH